MNFKPLGERVLIKRVEEETTTASGIIIPDNAKEKPLMGEVTAKSIEVESVIVGDKVVFDKYAGTELKLEGEVYLVMDIKDILGVLS